MQLGMANGFETEPLIWVCKDTKSWFCSPQKCLVPRITMDAPLRPEQAVPPEPPIAPLAGLLPPLAAAAAPPLPRPGGNKGALSGGWGPLAL